MTAFDSSNMATWHTLHKKKKDRSGQTVQVHAGVVFIRPTSTWGYQSATSGGQFGAWPIRTPRLGG